MSSDPVDDRDTVMGAIAIMTAAIDAVVDVPINTLTHPDLLTALGALESALWRVPAAAHQILARLEAEASPVELGPPRWPPWFRSGRGFRGPKPTSA